MKQNLIGPLAPAKRFSIAAAVLLPIVLAFAQPASAASCTTSNGLETLPGTGLGTISSAGCTIGHFSNPSVFNDSPAFVTPSNGSSLFNPSIYWFTWGGGLLTIQVETGNNGFGYDINFELGLKSGNTLNADKSLGSKLASNVVLWDNVAPTGGPNGPVNLFSGNLAAGDYVLDTYLGPCDPNHGACSQGTFNSTDPNFMVNFVGTGSSGQNETPLPAALPLFASGIGGLGFLGWRRKQKKLTA
jgi:hypothetical protein